MTVPEKVRAIMLIAGYYYRFTGVHPILIVKSMVDKEYTDA